MSLGNNIKKFNRLLKKDIASRLRGDHPKFNLYSGDWPSDKFPAGNLAPANQKIEAKTGERDEDEEEIPRFMKSNYRPPATGLAIYLEDINDDSVVHYEGGFIVYDTLHPRREKLTEKARERYGDDINPEDEIDYEPRFLKKKVEFEGELSLNELGERGFIEFKPDDVKEYFIGQKPETGKGFFRGVGGIPYDISYEDFCTEEAFENYKSKINDSGEEPNWCLKIYAKMREHDGSKRLDFYLSNRTDPPENRYDWYFDPYFFDPNLRLVFEDCDLTSVPLTEIEEEDYRYSDTVSATGRNCHARVEGKEIKTEILPVYEENFTNWKPHESLPNEATKFSVLGSEDPRPHLLKIVDAMRNYLSKWFEMARDKDGNKIPEKKQKVYSQVEDAREKFEREIERIERGVEALDDDKLRFSFRLMNKAFEKRLGSDGNWRLFQLGYILNEISDMLLREEDGSKHKLEDNPASVLWFPTGAGKTEAFTGLIITQAFYDRIRGKKFGVSAWAKFPLRFLSIQQLERAVTSMVAANRVFDDNYDAIHSLAADEEGELEKFSVGFLVGGSTTPNNPKKDYRGYESALKAVDSGSRPAEKIKTLATCPYCKLDGRGEGDVNLVGDVENDRIVHSCGVCDEDIPLYITDYEIYSNLPTFLISTIDKEAIFGRKPEAQTLLGVVRSRCPVHGYSFMPDRCIWSDCDKDTETVDGPYDGPPALMIQDEIHMLSESLGAFSAQYETFLRGLAEKVDDIEGMSSQGQWKTIASTATIAGYEDHMKNLYLKDSYVFPVKGPSSEQSFFFYKEEGDIQRKVVGFIPHNMTHPNAVIKILQYFHAFVKKYENNPGLLSEDFPEFFSDLDRNEEKKLIEYARTSLMYGIVRSETYHILYSIDDQIDPYLTQERGLEKGINESRYITGDTDPEDNLSLLKSLQSGDLKESPEFIVATSSISHGVDIDRLNFMVFRGQPRSTSEFIQAMSRVGREYQGLIFAVYNPNRERDSRHYMLHNEILQVSNVLIPPPSVDRFSRKAIDKSAGGVLLGLSLLGEEHKGYLRSNILLDHITEPAIKESLKDDFYTSFIPDIEDDYIPRPKKLSKYVSNVFETTINEAENKYRRESTDWSTNLLDCMYSLRQTDDLINIRIEDGKLLDEIRRLRKEGER